MPDAVVLYEDRRGPTNEFGLHNLVTACVADALGGSQWDWKRRIDGRPRKGSGNLLQDCRADAADIAWAEHPVLAVFDSDRIRELLNLPGNADEDQLQTAVDEVMNPSEHLQVFLLEKNQETVLEAAIRCGLRASTTEKERAIDKKKTGDRDKLMMRAAAGRRDVRDCILRSIPSLAAIVTHLVGLFSGSTSEAADNASE